jgi:sialic acid synthase SpsE
VKIGRIDLDQKVFVVAEIGNNHEGDFLLAQDLIHAAAQAGVDAVKFQTFVPEHFVSSADTARLARLRRYRLSPDQFRTLAQQANEAGLIFFSTPLDLESARFLDTIQPLFKIASGDNTFLPLIEAVAGFSKPLIISTGLADISLLQRVYAEVHRIWAKAGVSPGLAFLHCVASYPVPTQQVNLAAIRTLQDCFEDCVVGYSDHTLGVRAASYAVAAGARIIEKHFTLDKNHSDFRDHQLSADPTEMRQLVDTVREITEMLGTGHKVPQPCETELLVGARRSVAAARDLPTGSVLAATDLTWVRPGTGIPVGGEKVLIGRKTTRALRQGELIQHADVSAD